MESYWTLVKFVESFIFHGWHILIIAMKLNAVESELFLYIFEIFLSLISILIFYFHLYWCGTVETKISVKLYIAYYNLQWLSLKKLVEVCSKNRRGWSQQSSWFPMFTEMFAVTNSSIKWSKSNRKLMWRSSFAGERVHLSHTFATNISRMTSLGWFLLGFLETTKNSIKLVLFNSVQLFSQLM